MELWEYIRAKARLREENLYLICEKNRQIRLPQDIMRELAEFLTERYSRIVVCTVMMYFYAPDAMSGYKMCKNMRDKLAKAMRCSPTYISKKRNVALFLYDNDNNFHREVDDAIEDSVDYVNNILSE